MAAEHFHLRLGITLDQDGVLALTSLLRRVLAENAAANEKQEAHVRASQHAALGGKSLPDDKGLLVNSRQVAKLLNVCEKTVWSMHTTGRMPKPIRLGQRVLWGYEALKEWVNAGCPACS